LALSSPRKHRKDGIRGELAGNEYDPSGKTGVSHSQQGTGPSGLFLSGWNNNPQTQRVCSPVEIHLSSGGDQQVDFRISPSINVTLEELKFYLLGKIDISPERKPSADFNGDTIIDIADMILIMK